MIKDITAAMLLAATTAVAHAVEAPMTDPASGKACVSYFSSEPPTAGLVVMNYRNICSSPFEIRITTGEKVRRGNIKAGTPDKPAKGTVTCRSDDRCETADWEFDVPKGS